MVNGRVIVVVSNNLVSDNRVAKLALYLEGRGFEVWLFGRVWPGGDIPPGRAGKIWRSRLLFNKGPLFYLNLNIRILFFLIFHKARWIISVDLDTLPACCIAGKIKGTPVVMDSHEYFPEVPELQHRPLVKKIWLGLERLFIRGIHAGITVSPGIVAIYKKKYNLHFLLLRNVPFKSASVQKINPVTKNPLVYYQGALNIGRGLENSIRAIALLHDYRLLIVGDGDITTQLKELVSTLNLEQRVIFIDKVPFEELQGYMSGASVGLCLLENIGLNYYYSLPNRIFDYPMAGLPVIATNFPDIAAVVSKYKTGLLVDSPDPGAIARAIKKACSDRELRDLWAGTLAEAADQLNWDTEVAVLNTVFSSGHS